MAGTYVGTPSYLGNDQTTLASILQGEAGGTYAQSAVASTIANRAATNFSGYGTGLLDQALAPNQFQGQTAPGAGAQSVAAATIAGTQENDVPGALYYAAPNTPGNAAWANTLNSSNSVNIGGNYFSDNMGPASPQFLANADTAQDANQDTAGSVTGSPVGGDGSNIATQGFSLPVTDFGGSGISTGASGNSIAYNNPYTLGGDASGSSFQGAPAPDISASSTPYFGTPDSAPANPPQAMASVPGTTNSAGFASTLSGMWEALGVTAVTTAANTQANALTAATAAQNATAVADTGTLTGTIASAFNATFSNVSNLFVRGGVLLFGAIFLAAGLWFLARQQEA